MAVAGTPARAIPCTPRSATSTPNEPTHGSTMPMIAVSDADMAITRVRPNRSDSALAGMIDRASIPVVAETARADPAGDTSNASDNAGRTACAAYIATNVVIPAAKSDTVIRRYPVSPRRYPAGAGAVV